MKTSFNLFVLSLIMIFSGHLSYAVLDDNLGLTYRKHTPSIKRSIANKPVTKNNIQFLNKKHTQVTIKKSDLGLVPRHIKVNWNKLNKDQKAIIYSYHNEKPYADIGKDHFIEILKNRKNHEHDTAYGFDSSKQGGLDTLRADINESGQDNFSASNKLALEILAALE